LDPATGAGLNGEDGFPLLTDPPPPPVEMYCKGIAQSPVSGDIVLTCHTPDSVAPIVSYIWTFDPESGPQGLGELEIGNDQGYNRGAFDSSGNFYVTLTTLRRHWDLSSDTVLGLGKFEASQLEEEEISEPSEFAVYTDAYSNGTDVAVVVENGAPVIYATGHVDSSQGGTLDVDAVLVKFDAQGNLLWSVTYDGLGIGGHDSFNAVAVDDDGNVYVTGFRARELVGIQAQRWVNDMILAKYSSSGEELFMKNYNGDFPNITDDSTGNDVLLNADGEIFVVGGVFNGPFGDNNIAVWRYDNNGNNGDQF